MIAALGGVSAAAAQAASALTGGLIRTSGDPARRVEAQGYLDRLRHGDASALAALEARARSFPDPKHGFTPALAAAVQEGLVASTPPGYSGPNIQLYRFSWAGRAPSSAPAGDGGAPPAPRRSVPWLLLGVVAAVAAVAVWRYWHR